MEWTNRTFPNNIPWDYGYYVVSDTGAHSGTNADDALDVAAGSLDVDFSEPYFDIGTTGADDPDFTHGLGYSQSDDPNFMYCADNMTTNGADNWWIPICGLSGGSSGGPWMQDNNGNGSVMSVNSWGYTDGSPGMAGPKLNGNTAFCLFSEAQTISFGSVPTSDGNEGVTISACD